MSCYSSTSDEGCVKNIFSWLVIVAYSTLPLISLFSRKHWRLNAEVSQVSVWSLCWLTEAIQNYVCQFMSSVRFQTEHYTSTGSYIFQVQHGSTETGFRTDVIILHTHTHVCVMCIQYIWFLYWFWIRPMISPVSLRSVGWDWTLICIGRKAVSLYHV